MSRFQGSRRRFPFLHFVRFAETKTFDKH
jgi:hypothetical protein